MCRFIAYTGPDLVIADLIVRPKHSLIDQSFHAQEREERLNGDGFGVGWYNHALTDKPGVFTSTSPAWSNQNLRHLSATIASPLIFAHVRAASPGSAVNDLNCHPFRHHQLLWMHNGRIADFIKIKRHLRNTLRDDIYNDIQGTTDSEHAFAVFLNFLPENKPIDVHKLKKAMLATIAQLNEWTGGVKAKLASQYNFAVTDGHSIVATRYTDDPETPAETLYYSRGERFECDGDVCRVIPASKKHKAIIVASEPATPQARWEPVPVNHIVVIDKDLEMQIEPIIL